MAKSKGAILNNLLAIFFKGNERLELPTLLVLITIYLDVITEIFSYNSNPFL